METHYQSTSRLPESALSMKEDGQRLEGQVALVSHGGRGVGREQALQLAQRGACIIVADIDIDEAEQTAEDIRQTGGRAIAVAVDITDPLQAAKLIKYSPGIFGGLDILVNSVGIIYALNEIHASEEEDIEYLLTHNINAAISAGPSRYSGW